MVWRYQPVWTEEGGEKVFSVIEVYFEDDKKSLRSWTEKKMMTPQGDSCEELAGVLKNMLVDAMAWKPVRYEDLKSGMQFERRVSAEERGEMAELIEGLRAIAKVSS